MLTMKGKYGLKAVLHLARQPEGTLALSADIAAANTISKKFLDAILHELRTAGRPSASPSARRTGSARPALSLIHI